MPSRHEDIAAFYRDKAGELEGAVRRAVTGNRQLVEDACSYAWAQLLTRDHVTLDRAGFGWLYVVAIREAYGLSDRARRERPSGGPGDLPGRGLATEYLETTILYREEIRERGTLLEALPVRQREMVVLHAAGFTYAEIARICDVTLRTVERQMLRGKRTLRRQHQNLTT